MFHYEKMFEPFTKDGATLEGSIKWLKKSTDASDKIIDYAIADTMDKIANGETFELPCPCGCGMENVHTPINHYMLSKVYELKTKVDVIEVELIKKQQKSLLESQLKLLVKNDKQMIEALYGTWSQRNIPTFRKLFRMKD